MLYNEIKYVPIFCSGTFDSVEELHSGNINNTYRLVFRAESGRKTNTLQRQQLRIQGAGDRHAQHGMVCNHLRIATSRGVDPSGA